jgi:hypothetical protein
MAVKRKGLPPGQGTGYVQYAHPNSFRLTKAHGHLGLDTEFPGKSIYGDAEPCPDTVQEKQEMSRDWLKKCAFLQDGLALKMAFANYGFRLGAKRSFEQEGTEGTEKISERKAKNEAVKEWHAKWKRPIFRFMRETWTDWFAMDCAIAFWRDGNPLPSEGRGKRAAAMRVVPRVITLFPENCRYTDAMGVERLWWRPGWKRTELPESLRERYAGKEIELLEKFGEHFMVLKRARTGAGFGEPSMMALYKALNQHESLEVADNLWAYLGRAVTRHFKLGHEIKQGPYAGTTKHFWSKVRAEAVRKFFEGRFGILDYSSNFDVALEFPYPSNDRFDKKKYEGAFERIAQWLGPIGMLIYGSFGKGMEDVVMRLLKAEILEQRQEVGMHCEEVINEVFNPPVPVEIKWSNKIFVDTRQAMEFAKVLLANGSLSQRTGLEYVGEEAEEQRDFKREEGELSQGEKTKFEVLPIFDPNHGKRPGEPSGRPSGGTN